MNPLARIAYNMIAEGGEAVGKSAADDVLKAASRIADEGVEVLDDWGWKGGKEGEMTGTEFMKLMRRRSMRQASPTVKLSKDAADSAEKAFADAKAKALEQTKNAIEQKKLAQRFDLYSTTLSNMENFQVLEQADIPREWTGKVLKALQLSGMYKPDIVEIAPRLSNVMRRMYIAGDPETTKLHRETFLAMLPEWTGSLDELAEMARTV